MCRNCEIVSFMYISNEIFLIEHQGNFEAKIIHDVNYYICILLLSATSMYRETSLILSPMGHDFISKLWLYKKVTLHQCRYIIVIN